MPYLNKISLSVYRYLSFLFQFVNWRLFNLQNGYKRSTADTFNTCYVKMGAWYRDKQVRYMYVYMTEKYKKYWEYKVGSINKVRALHWYFAWSVHITQFIVYKWATTCTSKMYLKCIWQHYSTLKPPQGKTWVKLHCNARGHWYLVNRLYMYCTSLHARLSPPAIR